MASTKNGTLVLPLVSSSFASGAEELGPQDEVGHFVGPPRDHRQPFTWSPCLHHRLLMTDNASFQDGSKWSMLMEGEGCSKMTRVKKPQETRTRELSFITLLKFANIAVNVSKSSGVDECTGLFLSMITWRKKILSAFIYMGDHFFFVRGGCDENSSSVVSRQRRNRARCSSVSHRNGQGVLAVCVEAAQSPNTIRHHIGVCTSSCCS